MVLIHSCKYMRVFKEEEPKRVPNPSFNDLTSRLFVLLNLAVNCTIHQRKKCIYNSQSNPVRIHTPPLFSPTQYYFSSFPVPSHFTKSIPFTLRYIMTDFFFPILIFSWLTDFKIWDKFSTWSVKQDCCLS